MHPKSPTAAAALSAVKWLGFAACAACFAWKTAGCYLNYLAEEVGSGLELVPNQRAGMPSFALCRPADQVLDFWDAQGRSLLDKHNLTQADFRYLKSWRVLGDDYAEVFREHLSDRPESVGGAKIFSRTRATTLSWPSYYSRPGNDSFGSGDWSVMRHPVHGTCFVFEFGRNVSDYVGDGDGGGGVSLVELSFEPSAAYQDPDDYSYPNGDRWRSDEALYSAEGAGSASVFAFAPGSFWASSSGRPVALTRDAHEYLILEQEMLDMSDAQKKFSCADGDDGEKEDDCLSACLVRKSVEEFGCVHPRLVSLDALPAGDRRECGLSDVEKKTTERLEVAAALMEEDGFDHHRTDEDWDDATASEEAGLAAIREWIAGFASDRADDPQRCGCPVPCRRKHVKLRTWKSKAAWGEQHVLAVFQFDALVKRFSYHFLYTWSDFLADLGGYLGLFLGISVFSVVEVAEKTIKARKQKKKKKESSASGREQQDKEESAVKT